MLEDIWIRKYFKYFFISWIIDSLLKFLIDLTEPEKLCYAFKKTKNWQFIVKSESKMFFYAVLKFICWIKYGYLLALIKFYNSVITNYCQVLNFTVKIIILNSFLKLANNHG